MTLIIFGNQDERIHSKSFECVIPLENRIEYSSKKIICALPRTTENDGKKGFGFDELSAEMTLELFGTKLIIQSEYTLFALNEFLRITPQPKSRDM